LFSQIGITEWGLLRSPAGASSLATEVWVPGLQVFRSSGLQVFKFSSFQVFKFSSFQVFRFQISDFRFQISDFRFQNSIAKLGPSRVSEFSFKRCGYV
jgi:hypothetical protein